MTDISRMTIKRIYTSDPLSVMKDKINFNFDQVQATGGKKGDKGVK